MLNHWICACPLIVTPRVKHVPQAWWRCAGIWQVGLSKARFSTIHCTDRWQFFVHVPWRYFRCKSVHRTNSARNEVVWSYTVTRTFRPRRQLRSPVSLVVVDFCVAWILLEWQFARFALSCASRICHFRIQISPVAGYRVWKMLSSPRRAIFSKRTEFVARM